MKTIAVESCGKGNSEYEERELICIILHPHLNFTMYALRLYKFIFVVFK